MSNPETPIQKAILDLVNRTGLAKMWRNNTGAARGGKLRIGLCPGSADLIGVLRGGTFVAIEVKVPGKDASPQQRAFLAEVIRLGGVAIVAHSPEEALAELRKWEGEHCCPRCLAGRRDLCPYHGDEP